MNHVIGWGVPVLIWAVVTVGARGWLKRFRWSTHPVGDWGTAFLLGYTLFTVLVYLLALAGVRIGPSLLVGAALVVFGSGWLLARRGSDTRDDVEPARPERWTPGEFVLLAALVVYSVLAAVNSLYLPVAATDAHSYAGRAFYMLHEGTLNIDIYNWPGIGITGATNITYPPLHSLGFAVSPAFGGWQPKLVNGLFSIAYPLVVFGALRRFFPRFASMFWALLIAMTPEVFSHAGYALLNVPAMSLIIAEGFALHRFVQRGGTRWLYLAGIFGMGAAGIRPDALVIHAVLGGTAAVFAVYDTELRSSWRSWGAAWSACALAPLLTWGTWTLYLIKVVKLDSLTPLTGAETFGLGFMFREVPGKLFWFDANGAVFYVWAGTLPFLVLARKREAFFFQALAVGCLLALIVLFSTIQVGFGGSSPEEVLFSSFKRSLLYVVPFAGVGTAFTLPWVWLAFRGKGWIHDAEVPKGAEPTRAGS